MATTCYAVWFNRRLESSLKSRREGVSSLDKLGGGGLYARDGPGSVRGDADASAPTGDT